jgi:hypothetical protein
MSIVKCNSLNRVYVFMFACMLTPANYGWAQPHNTLSAKEKAQGFTLLFDGSSMDQWRNYRAETIKPQWQISDGAMVLTEKGGRDIITKEQYGFFDLRLEWTIANGGNGGIMFRVDEQTTKRLPWMVSPEYQLKDPYGKPRKSAGALYGLQNNRARLTEDHDNAKRLAVGLNQIDGLKVEPEHVCTNIVVIGTTSMDPVKIVEKLNGLGVLVLASGADTIRAVTNLHIKAGDIGQVVSAFKKVVSEIQRT